MSGPRGYARSIVLFAALIASVQVHAALNPASRDYTWDGKVFTVPLEIKDNSGVARREWPVTSGVPLPYGLVRNTAELRLTDSSGHELPCQFHVLSRYWARDRSIRWVLLDFQVDVPARGAVVVDLTNRAPHDPVPHPIAVVETKDAIRVDTGPLTAVIPKRDASIFSSVRVGQTEILHEGPGDGPMLRSGAVHHMEHDRGSHWNTQGWTKTQTVENVNIAEAVYRPRAAASVAVESSGPLRTVMVIRGRYEPTGDGPGIVKRGIYNYTTRLHFYRGRTFVKVEHAIENSDRKPPLTDYMFHEAGLVQTLRLKGDVTLTGGGREGLEGKRPVARTRLPQGEEGWLYQSAGKTELKYGRFRAQEGTYRMGLGHDGVVTKSLAVGKRARFLDVSDGRVGVTVAMKYFWEDAPRAVALSARHMKVFVQADSPGRVATVGGLRPEYDLDFGQRNLHDVLYYFHEGGADQARSSDVAEAFEYPLMAPAPPAWYSDTGVWYFEAARTPGNFARERNSGDEHWTPAGAGIRRHGENDGYNSGGNHDSLTSGWLKFIETGALSELEKDLAYGEWSISRNPGWAYRDNVIRFGEGSGRYAMVDRALADWNVLTGFGPKDFYLWQAERTHEVKTARGGFANKPVGGWTYLNGYKILPDYEHYGLFRLFEYYYMTGDVRALEAIHGFVNWDINFQEVHLFRGRMQPLTVTDYFKRDSEALWRGHYSRVYTWMLYTNIAGFRATGSPVFDEFARWQIRRLLGVLRQRHGQLTSILRKYQTDPGSSMRRFLEESAVPVSIAQSWMEAQGVLALHEAYRTYHDERILDGIWAQADYFSHHVLFYPRLGMINNWTTMPTDYLGDLRQSISPFRHDRLFQAYPYLYHYTGWKDVLDRYRSLVAGLHGYWVDPGSLQVLSWESENVAKKSRRAPEAIMDLRVERAERSGIVLTWTSPRDDGPTGRASRYFVKYSDKPIVEFAPTDNPSRAAEVRRVIREVEDHVLARQTKLGWKVQIKPEDFIPEKHDVPRHDPEWPKVNAFWMAEHVAGEPTPGPAGSRERFTIKELWPHDWFGAPKQPGLEILHPGTYYVAICSWDEDRNLSHLSNVVKFELK